MEFLPQKLRRFYRDSKRLNWQFDDTAGTYKDILKTEIFKQENLEQLKLESNQFHELINKPPAIVVLGQSCYAKALVVNSLFREPVLPVSREHASSGEFEWRMVQFSFGYANNISIALGSSFEIIERLQIYEQRDWETVTETDLRMKQEDPQDSLDVAPFVEIKLCHPLLHNGVQIIMPPRWQNIELFTDMICQKMTTNFLIFTFVIDGEELNDLDIQELRELKRLLPDTSVFFLKLYTPRSPTIHDELTESEQYEHLQQVGAHGFQYNGTLQDEPPDDNDSRADISFNYEMPTPHDQTNFRDIVSQLTNLGYIFRYLWPNQLRHGQFLNSSMFVEELENFHMFSKFVSSCLKSRLIAAAEMLHDSHKGCVRMFILNAFDMAREMQITPRRLEYAKQKETQLYQSLMEIAVQQQQDMGELIHRTIQDMREGILEKAAAYTFQGVEVTEGRSLPSSKAVVVCTDEIRDLVLANLNVEVAGQLIGSVNCLRDTFIGTLQRCLSSLERDWRTVEDRSASSSLKQILNAAYNVELTGQPATSSVRSLLERMKQLMANMPWSAPPQVDAAWKQKVAAHMMDSISHSKLAKSVCAQFRERLKTSHDAFLQSLRQLEWYHSGRLEKTGEIGFKLRKVYAPKVSKLALETSSMVDMVLHGMPQLGRELGRGQYGIVFSCSKWGPYKSCAVKSVVPPDDKHWNDLAMEYYYTRNVPDHDRIIKLHGSVVDYTYGGGATPAVLIVMERMERDLYCGIKIGLSWTTRMKIALQVVEGIRYLHSQGLIHRDIKLKNVLLDVQNNAKLSDLGFCKPEAMISGSIVGTPIHMAPELFTGRYDSSVDIYAFGILFWYVCSGKVQLPYVFEQCQNKEQLWNNVRQGARPELLQHFDSECWNVMTDCWATEPDKRPLLGEVEGRLQTIFRKHPEENWSPDSRDHSSPIVTR